MNLNIMREDFPMLKVVSNGQPLLYADSAATSLRPLQVMTAMDSYYHNFGVNVHRGSYELSVYATEKYELVRKSVASFINASPEEIIFTRGATDALNMASRMLKSSLQRDDEIMVSVMEHHSNLVPWQELAKETGAVLRFVQVTPDFELDMAHFEQLLSSKTKIVAITHSSNVLGTIVDVRRISELAHKVNALVVIDAAQSIPHMKIDVRDIGCDFLCFSGHKMLGPTGVGVLYGKRLLLDLLPPVSFGGDMISSVTLERATWNTVPHKFESGTPPIAEVIGLGAAIEYLEQIGIENIYDREQDLATKIVNEFEKLSRVKLFGPKLHRGLAFSFVVDGMDVHDVASLLDAEGIAVRTGQLCAMPLVQEVLKQDSVIRASFSWYNSSDEIARFFTTLKSIIGGIN